MIAHQNKLKPIIEDMEQKKWLKSLDRLKYNVDQDVMVRIDFNPSPVHFTLWVTVISDDGWCWALEWWKLGVLIVYFIPLTNIASVQLGSLCNYVDVLQAAPQVQYLNELFPRHGDVDPLKYLSFDIMAWSESFKFNPKYVNISYLR